MQCFLKDLQNLYEPCLKLLKLLFLIFNVRFEKLLGLAEGATVQDKHLFLHLLHVLLPFNSSLLILI